jgi:hypothetical protein
MADTERPTASLSLDLDNLWSYLKTHGDPSWQNHPSYLELVVPRLLEFFSRRGQLLTFFVVGQDAAMPSHRAPLRELSSAGHEIGNHSFAHEPWFHLYSKDRTEKDIVSAEQAIEAATGVLPRGFRGPGYSVSNATLEVLAEREYLYDCSTLPSFLGPIARWYYFRTSQLDHEQRRERARLFGTFREGLRPLRADRWATSSPSLGDRRTGQLRPGVIEIPVTTAPVIKTPIHCSYLLYLSRYSQTTARLYLKSALGLCRALDIEPSLLLHPLDFLGGEDVESLAFFPAMEIPAAIKLQRVSEYLDIVNGAFDVVPMAEHARIASQRTLRTVDPDFSTAEVNPPIPIEKGAVEPTD